MTSLPLLEPDTQTTCCPPAAPTLGADEAQRRAVVFKALADPNRLRLLSIVKRRRRGGVLCLRPHRTAGSRSAHCLPPSENPGRGWSTASREARHLGVLLAGPRSLGRRRRNPRSPMNHGFGVRTMTPTDWPAVQRIFQEGIETGHATFEEKAPPDWESFNTSRLPAHRLVAETAGRAFWDGPPSPPSRPGLYTRAWSSTPSTLRPKPAASDSAKPSFRPSSTPLNKVECGPSNPTSSRKITPASGSTKPPASGSSAAGAASPA